MRKIDEPFNNVVCKECGYNNKRHYAKFFGTCLCCGNIIDEKAKFKYEMNKRLLLYRKDKRDERKFTLYNK